MSGAFLGSYGVRTAFTNSYTVNVDDGGIFGLGYSGPNAFGSLTPSTSFRGATIQTILSPSIAGGDVAIQILGNLRQDFFTRLRIQTKTGALIDLFTVAAVFTPGASSLWSWTSAGEIWDFGTVGLNRSVDLTFSP